MNYEKGARPDNGTFLGFDHIRFCVGNAKQAAHWYCVNLGFDPFAYRGLETGCRNVAAHAIRQNKIIFVFESALLPANEDIGAHLVHHGDGVKDVVFAVDDIDQVLAMARKAGAKIVKDLTIESDEHGSVKYAIVQTGLFLPGFQTHKQLTHFFDSISSTSTFLSEFVGLTLIDHCVGNQPDLQMEEVVAWYEKVLSFHRFWSADDSVIHSDYFALRSIVIANYDETIKMPLNEPATGKRAVSQIQEFVDFWGGAGVQHISLSTSAIITAIRTMRSMYQSFQGFGAGNFKALFKCLEVEQNAKGNLFYDVVTKEGKTL